MVETLSYIISRMNKDHTKADDPSGLLELLYVGQDLVRHPASSVQVIGQLGPDSLDSSRVVPYLGPRRVYLASYLCK